jgi:hypothetical protein
MGAPDNLEKFVRFEADDLAVYVSRELLDKLESATRKMRFYIDGYGGFWLNFAEPWRGAE